jgi:hypothetical protein
VFLKRLQVWANKNRGFIALIGIVITGIGIFRQEIFQAISSLLGTVPKIVATINQYGGVIIGIGIFLIVLALTLAYRSYVHRLSIVEEKLQILETLPEILLDEATSANLSNWKYGRDKWASDKDGLSVTRSSYGGICRIGSTWENYDFTFEFKIMNKCAAWIVRAKSREQYVMVQCNALKVRPHTLIEQTSEANKRKFRVVTEIEHNLTLAEWNKVKTEVRGHSIKVWIEDNLVWTDSELLEAFPMGTVGFRCSRDEHALFRNIRVTKIKV